MVCFASSATLDTHLDSIGDLPARLSATDRLREARPFCVVPSSGIGRSSRVGVSRPNFTGRVDLQRHWSLLQVLLQPARHGGQWPLIWQRTTTSRGCRDFPDFRPVPRASCHPIPPLYLIPRPSRPTSPVSVSNNDRQYRMVRSSRNVRLRNA